MGGLVLGTLIGFLLGLPQLLPALQYWPQSIRAKSRTYSGGQVPLSILFKGLLTPRSCDRSHGLFFPEVCIFAGWLPLLSAWYAPVSYWHGVLLLGVLGATGRWMPPGFRLPARFCWLISVSITILGLHGLPYLPVSQVVLILLVGLQAFSLLLASWMLLPMEPFCQRWERPSQVFDTCLTRFLARSLGRVSGLSYPLRTGQINRIHTLGYNGGSQPTWMQRLRRDRTVDGAGAHDWFLTRGDGTFLDHYGIAYALTSRTLRHPKWKKTSLPWLWQNANAIIPPPTWSQLSCHRP